MGVGIDKSWYQSMLAESVHQRLAEDNGRGSQPLRVMSVACGPACEISDVVRTKDDLYFHVDAVNELKNRLVDFLKTNEEITTPQFKEMTGVSRKYVIPLIEYFDASKVTLRVGDSRKLRKG